MHIHWEIMITIKLKYLEKKSNLRGSAGAVKDNLVVFHTIETVICTITAIVATFICTKWNNRELRQDEINILKKNIILNHKHHRAILKDIMNKIVNDQYCQLSSTILENILITF